MLGNVVPAHHGLPVTPLPEGSEADSAEPFARGLAQWRALLSPVVDGSEEREFALPFHPVSVQAFGYPLPEETSRRGTPQLQVSVEDDPWTLVDDLSVQGPGDEVFVLRATPTGGASLRWGDGVNGAVLPPRETTLGLSLRVGLGTAANVGEGVLTRLLQVPLDPQRSASAGELLAQSMDDVRALVRVDNPLPAVEGATRSRSTPFATAHRLACRSRCPPSRSTTTCGCSSRCRKWRGLRRAPWTGTCARSSA